MMYKEFSNRWTTLYTTCEICNIRIILLRAKIITIKNYYSYYYRILLNSLISFLLNFYQVLLSLRLAYSFSHVLFVPFYFICIQYSLIYPYWVKVQSNLSWCLLRVITQKNTHLGSTAIFKAKTSNLLAIVWK